MIQHYVPRVYLKNFAEKRKRQFYVNVYNKSSKANFESNIKNICGETNLYTLTAEDDEYFNPLMIEDGYSKYFEPMYQTAYEILTNDAIVEISEDQRSKILLAVFQFYFRNTKIINEAVKFHRSRISQIFMEAKRTGATQFKYINQTYLTNVDLKKLLDKFEAQTRYSFKKDHLQGFKELALANSLQTIFVYKLIDDSKFVTSDNPLRNLNIRGDSMNPFQRTSQFILPLNEKYCLFLFNDKAKDYYRVYREDSYNGKAYKFNSDIIEDAQRFVIGDQYWITETLQWEEIVNDEYENNIHKFMTLTKQLYLSIKLQNAPLEYLRVFEKYINKYNNDGTLSDEDKQRFMHECKLEQNKYWINKL